MTNTKNTFQNTPYFTLPRIIALLTTLTAIVLLVMPAPSGVEPIALKGLGVCLFAVGLFATVAVSEHLSAMLFMAVAMIIGIAPADVVFSGFHSTAFWLMFGGIIIGVAVQQTGLGRVIVSSVLGRFLGGYTSLVIGIVLVCILLSFLMPSTMGRIILLVPLMLALADHMGYAPESNERKGILLAAICGTWMPAAGILPSNVPNMILAGVSERSFDIVFNYGSYLITQFPVNSAFKAMTLIAAILFLFPGSSKSTQPPDSQETPHPLRADGKFLAGVLVITIGLWATDFWHHISPAWIGLAAAIICMMPGTGLLSPEDFKTKVNFPSTIYLAGILGLGAVLVETGAGDIIGDWLLAHVPLSKDAPFTSFVSMIGLGMAVSAAATVPSVPVIVGPMADQIAAMTGFPIETVLMSQVIAYTSIFLPYQVPPLVVGFYLGGISLRDGAKVILALALIAVLLVIPLNYLWWSWLGLFG